MCMFLFITPGGRVFFFTFTYRQTRPQYPDSSHRHVAVIAPKLVTPGWVLCVADRRQHSIFLVSAIIIRAVVTKQIGVIVRGSYRETLVSVTRTTAAWLNKDAPLDTKPRAFTAFIVARVTADEIKIVSSWRVPEKSRSFLFYFSFFFFFGCLVARDGVIVGSPEQLLAITRGHAVLQMLLSGRTLMN